MNTQINTAVYEPITSPTPTGHIEPKPTLELFGLRRSSISYGQGMVVGSRFVAKLG